MSLSSRLIQSRIRQSIGSRAVRTASSAGVVRIVKPTDIEQPITCESMGIPLLNRTPTEPDRVDRVAVDVRVADLFRQYKAASDKTTLMSVLENLSLMNINNSVLIKFPGFIQLVNDLGARMARAEISNEELIRVTEILTKMRLKPRGESSGIDSDALALGFSNQLVSALDSMSKVDLTKTIIRIERHMQLQLDLYFYWALDKEVTKWASNTSLSDEEYVESVLGPLQVLAQEPLVDRVGAVFMNPAIEGRIISLIRGNKLNNLQVLELVHNLKATGFTQMIQVAISHVLTGYKPKLQSSVSDLAVIISALPEGPVRDSDVQSQLAQLVRSHLETPPADPTKLKRLLECVSGIVVDPTVDRDILHIAAPLIKDNILVVNKLDPSSVADLLYVYATGSLACTGDKELFQSVCSQIESVVVGRLPQIKTAQLARLSLAFGSGILNNANSFKALGATVRSKAASFAPHEFAEAVYGMAFRGILGKSTLVEGHVDIVAQAVPTVSLPKLAWSVAVADYSVPAVWDVLMGRIEKEILMKPAELEKLSHADEMMLYETLVAAKQNNYATITKNVERRISSLEERWAGPPISRSEIDYAPLLENLEIEAQFDVVDNKQHKLCQIPIYLPEFKLVIDATRGSVAAGGLTHGSIKLRHSLWSKMGFNVIAIPDAQFSDCKTVQERTNMLGSIITQFTSEIESNKSPVTAKPAEWTSRQPRERSESKANDWASRKDSAPRRSNWSSRVE